MIKKYKEILLIIFWPFIFLAPYTFKLNSPGNDFTILYYNYKAYLVSFWSQGIFPMWAPSEGLGFPLYSNPFAQYFYPLNILYVFYNLLTGSFTTWDYTLFTILSFSVFGLGLYFWLCALKFSKSIVLVAVLIALMSLKITELIRFPNAAQAASWIPWMLYSLTILHIREKWKSGLWIFGISMVMMITAGYPYLIIYSFFIIAPFYIFLLFSREKIFFENRQNDFISIKNYIVSTSILIIGAGLLVMPYLLSMKNLMAQTVDRAKPNFLYATEHKFGPMESLGSWVFPALSTHEGWYYFGITTTLLISVFILILWLDQIKNKRDSSLALFGILLIIFITYFTWGDQSILFKIIWHLIPFLDQMRVWGRMNIVLVPLITLMLCISIKYFIGRYKDKLYIKLLIVLLTFIIIIQLVIIGNHNYNWYWLNFFKISSRKDIADGFPWDIMKIFNEQIFLYASLFCGVVIIMLCIYARFNKKNYVSQFLFLFVLFTYIEMAFISNYQWAAPFYSSVPKISEELISKNFFLPRVPNPSTVDPVDGQTYAGALANWGYERHMKIYSLFFNTAGVPINNIPVNDLEYAKRFYGLSSSAEKLFFSEDIKHNSIQEYLDDVNAYAVQNKFTIKDIKYSGDVLNFNFSTEKDGWITFVDNWDSDWVAILNGSPVKIVPLMGAYKSVKVTQGNSSNLIFIYKPSFLSKTNASK